MMLLTTLNCAVWVYIHFFTLHDMWHKGRAHKANVGCLLSFLYTLALVLMAAWGVLFSPFWFAGHLLMVVNKSVLLAIVIRSVLLNGWSLFLTALLTFIVVYLFIIIGYVFFQVKDIASAPHVQGWGGGGRGLPAQGGGMGGYLKVGPRTSQMVRGSV